MESPANQVEGKLCPLLCVEMKCHQSHLLLRQKIVSKIYNNFNIFLSKFVISLTFFFIYKIHEKFGFCSKVQ
jgi:hypothetical protein